MVGRLAIALSLSLAAITLLGAHHVHAFTSQSHTHALQGSRPRASTELRSSFFADATEPKTPEAKVQVDANGKPFAPGARVAIAPNRIVKAYHVPKAAFGTFDPATGQFVPLDESNATRKISCLVLPEGLQGEVKMVYNTNEWDRAHPILVKLGTGEDRAGGGGFDIPKAFTMHVDADEIVVLDM